MKKFILSAALLTGGFFLHAQDIDFGITAGYLNVEGKIKADDLTLSASESGFYVGAVVDFTINEKFHIQPEALYASIDDADGILIPIMGKYYVANKFSLQAGPQLVFSLEETIEDFSSVEFDLAFGLGFDITDAFFLEGRYTFQLNNSYTGPEDVTVRGNYLTLGVGYKF
jgi:hypothetical protein